jgi:hypothetical protein
MVNLPGTWLATDTSTLDQTKVCRIETKFSETNGANAKPAPDFPARAL